MSLKSSDANNIVDYTPKAKTQLTEAFSIKLNHNSKIDFSNVDMIKDQTGRRETTENYGKLYLGQISASEKVVDLKNRMDKYFNDKNRLAISDYRKFFNEKQNLDKNSPTPQPRDPQIKNPRIDAATPSKTQPVPLEAYPKKKEPTQLPADRPTIFDTYQKGFLGHKDIKIYNSFQKIKRNQSCKSISLTNDQGSPPSVTPPKEISPSTKNIFTLISKRESFSENLEHVDKKEESFLNRKNKDFFDELTGEKVPTKNDLLLDSYKNKYLPSNANKGANESEDSQSYSIGLGLGGPKRESEFGFVGKKMGVDDLGKMDKAEIGGRGKYERVDKESKDYFEGPRKVGGGKGEKLDDKGRLCTPGLSGLGNVTAMAIGNDR